MAAIDNLNAAVAALQSANSNYIAAVHSHVQAANSLPVANPATDAAVQAAADSLFNVAASISNEVASVNAATAALAAKHS